MAPATLPNGKPIIKPAFGVPPANFKYIPPAAAFKYVQTEFPSLTASPTKLGKSVLKPKANRDQKQPDNKAVGNTSTTLAGESQDTLKKPLALDDPAEASLSNIAHSLKRDDPLLKPEQGHSHEQLKDSVTGKTSEAHTAEVEDVSKQSNSSEVLADFPALGPDDYYKRRDAILNRKPQRKHKQSNNSATDITSTALPEEGKDTVRKPSESIVDFKAVPDNTPQPDDSGFIDGSTLLDDVKDVKGESGEDEVVHCDSAALAQSDERLFKKRKPAPSSAAPGGHGTINNAALSQTKATSQAMIKTSKAAPPAHLTTSALHTTALASSQTSVSSSSTNLQMVNTNRSQKQGFVSTREMSPLTKTSFCEQLQWENAKLKDEVARTKQLLENKTVDFDDLVLQRDRLKKERNEAKERLDKIIIQRDHWKKECNEAREGLDDVITQRENAEDKLASKEAIIEQKESTIRGLYTDLDIEKTRHNLHKKNTNILAQRARQMAVGYALMAANPDCDLDEDEEYVDPDVYNVELRAALGVSADEYAFLKTKREQEAEEEKKEEEKKAARRAAKKAKKAKEAAKEKGPDGLIAVNVAADNTEPPAAAKHIKQIADEQHESTDHREQTTTKEEEVSDSVADDVAVGNVAPAAVGTSTQNVLNEDIAVDRYEDDTAGMQGPQSLTSNLTADNLAFLAATQSVQQISIERSSTINSQLGDELLALAHEDEDKVQVGSADALNDSQGSSTPLDAANGETLSDPETLAGPSINNTLPAAAAPSMTISDKQHISSIKEDKAAEKNTAQLDTSDVNVGNYAPFAAVRSTQKISDGHITVDKSGKRKRVVDPAIPDATVNNYAPLAASKTTQNISDEHAPAGKKRKTESGEASTDLQTSTTPVDITKAAAVEDLPNLAGPLSKTGQDTPPSLPADKLDTTLLAGASGDGDMHPQTGPFVQQQVNTAAANTTTIPNSAVIPGSTIGGQAFTATVSAPAAIPGYTVAQACTAPSKRQRWVPPVGPAAVGDERDEARSQRKRSKTERDGADGDSAPMWASSMPEQFR